MSSKHLEQSECPQEVGDDEEWECEPTLHEAKHTTGVPQVFLTLRVHKPQLVDIVVDLDYENQRCIQEVADCRNNNQFCTFWSQGLVLASLEEEENDKDEDEGGEGKDTDICDELGVRSYCHCQINIIITS